MTSCIVLKINMQITAIKGGKDEKTK